MSDTGVRVGEIYAQTLFELSEESKMADTVKVNLEALGGAIATEPDFGKFITSPYFSGEFKSELLRKVFSGKLADLTMDFLMVVIRHNRMAFLSHIIDRYIELWDLRNGFCNVKISVGQPMESSEIEKLAEEIATELNCKVKMECEVKPDVIGGIAIRYGNKVVDNTVKTRLRKAVEEITSRERRREKIHEV
jgi:F-type H+-transporting ATPase subunit delta